MPRQCVRATLNGTVGTSLVPVTHTGKFKYADHPQAARPCHARRRHNSASGPGLSALLSGLAPGPPGRNVSVLPAATAGFLYNCVLSRNILLVVIPSRHTLPALRVAFCDPVLSGTSDVQRQSCSRRSSHAATRPLYSDEARADHRSASRFRKIRSERRGPPPCPAIQVWPVTFARAGPPIILKPSESIQAFKLPGGACRTGENILS